MSSSKSLFASQTLAEHLLRGIFGIVAIYFAIKLGQNPTTWWATPASLGLGVVSLVLFRGCPICWTIGFIETLYRQIQRFQSRILRRNRQINRKNLSNSKFKRMF